MAFYKFIHSFFTHNLGVKISVLFLSIFLWLYIVVQNQYVYTINVPLEIHNLMENRALKEPIPRYVKAKFMGKGSELIKALSLKKYSNFKFVIDLQNIRNFYYFPLNEYYSRNPEKIVIPRGFNLKFLEIEHPDTVKIILDRYLEKSVPVRVQVQISPAPGFIQVGQLQVVPTQITVSGPSSAVSKIDTIFTESRSFQEVTTPIRINIPIKFDTKDIMQTSHKEVEVFQDIQTIGEIEIADVPVTVKNLPSYLKAVLTPTRVTLVITGGVEYISSIKPDEIKIYIDYKKQWKPDQYYYTPIVEIPPDVLSWHDLKPKQIEFRVIRKQK